MKSPAYELRKHHAADTVLVGQPVKVTVMVKINIHAEERIRRKYGSISFDLEGCAHEKCTVTQSFSFICTWTL